MGRQRPARPSAGCRTTTASAASRRSRTTPTSSRRTEPGKQQIPISRRNFVELCERLTVEDEKVFEQLWRRLGLSVDWTLTYQTIDERARAVSQRAFLRNLERGEAYQAEAPTLWDVTFRTAVAQAELEDRERDSAYHAITFHRPDGDDITIDTTRPELIPACVALVAHPDDERYQPLFGSTVRTPLFDVEVPVLAHPLADPEKGTGIAMICTFGDLTDVTGGASSNLPTRAIIGRDGRVIADIPDAITVTGRASAYARLAGSTVFTAKQTIVEMLRESGDLIGDPRPIKHPVKFYEKGDKPLEIVSTRQWYIRNGGRDELLRAAPARARRRAALAPEPHEGALRQLGLRAQRRLADLAPAVLRGATPALVPPRRRTASRSTTTPSFRADDALPIDPQSETPPGFTEDQRGVAGGLHRRPRHHGHLGDLVADPADRRRMDRSTTTCTTGSSRWTCARRRTRSSAPGCSRRWCAPTPSTTSCRGATSPSPAGSSTPTARR